MERGSRDLGKILEGQKFEDREEANAFLRRLLKETGGRIPEAPPQTPLEKAQNLCWRAWDEDDPKKARRLARQALRLSGDCADAYNILAARETRNTPQRLEFYGKALAAAQRALGPEAFGGSRGHFWGILETRPYMRARAGVAFCLAELGRMDEAIAHFEALLELNPNDNQGNRTILLSLYIEADRLQSARGLLDRYENDASEDVAWNRVLVTYLLDGPDQAGKALADAREVNEHVPGYLLGNRKLPATESDYVVWGSPEAAAAAVRLIKPGWSKHPKAVAWLESAVPRNVRRGRKLA